MNEYRALLFVARGTGMLVAAAGTAAAVGLDVGISCVARDEGQGRVTRCLVVYADSSSIFFAHRSCCLAFYGRRSGVYLQRRSHIVL